MGSAGSGGWVDRPSRAGNRSAGRPAFGSVAAVGIGTLGVTAGLTVAAWAGLLRQARAAATVIEAAAMQATLADGTLPPGAALPSQAVPPQADGIYLPDGDYLPDGFGPSAPLSDLDAPADSARAHRAHTYPAYADPAHGRGTPSDGVLRLAMVGDSTSVGYGCATAEEVPGVVLARRAAAALDRPVELRSVGVVGSGAADLARQVDLVLADPVNAVVVVTGANDITARIPPWRSAARLGAAVGRLRATGIPVVVGTCPDLGVITSIPQPLRSLVGAWSRRLAAMQARAAAAAGGRAVMIGRLVSPEFRGRPDLFYADGFHPSGAGYARAAAALLPEVITALDSSPVRAPGQGRTPGTAQDQAPGAGQGRTPVQDQAPRTAQDQAPDESQGRAPSQDQTPGTAQDQTPDEGHGHAPSQDQAPGTAQDQTPGEGHGRAPAQDRTPGTAQDQLPGTAQDPGARRESGQRTNPEPSAGYDLKSDPG